MLIHGEILARFVLISLLAWGGGQAALPLLEQAVVFDTKWLAPATFGSAVAFSYFTPGPVLIIATFVGYHVAGWSGALAATIGVFTVPWALATLMAKGVVRLAADPRLAAFAAGASPAAVGLLGVTALDIGRQAFGDWPDVALGAVLFAIAAWRGVHLNPALLLAAGGMGGWLIDGG